MFMLQVQDDQNEVRAARNNGRTAACHRNMTDGTTGSGLLNCIKTYMQLSKPDPVV